MGGQSCFTVGSKANPESLVRKFDSFGMFSAPIDSKHRIESSSMRMARSQFLWHKTVNAQTIKFCASTPIPRLLPRAGGGEGWAGFQACPQIYPEEFLKTNNWPPFPPKSCFPLCLFHPYIFFSPLFPPCCHGENVKWEEGTLVYSGFFIIKRSSLPEVSYPWLMVQGHIVQVCNRRMYEP